MVNQSIVQQRGLVAFPSFMAERVYMREFRKETGLPTDLKRWQPTVDAMLDGVDTDGPIYLMIDQGIVKAGNAQRRPGMHIDGYWHPAVRAHGGVSRHGSTPPPGRNPKRGYPDDGFEDVKWTPVREGHGGQPARHSASASGEWDHSYEPWKHCDFTTPEGIILASDVRACRALSGTYMGNPGEGGDCSHLSLSGMDEIILDPFVAYAGNVAMLHESLPVDRDVMRTLVRLNVPGWTPVIQ